MVGNNAVKHANHSVSWTGYRSLLVFLAVTMMVIDLDDIVRGGKPQLRTRGMIASRSVNMVSHRRGSYIVIPIEVSGVATPENKVTHWRCHP